MAAQRGQSQPDPEIRVGEGGCGLSCALASLECEVEAGAGAVCECEVREDARPVKLVAHWSQPPVRVNELPIERHCFLPIPLLEHVIR
eukprot:2061703-Rhodomonas_salina.1